MSTTTLPPLVATPAPAPLPTSHPDPDLNSRPFDVHDLLQHLLDSHSNSQIMTAGGHNKKPKLLEEVKLDSFLLHHAKSYEFPSSGYKKLVNVLIQERIMNSTWSSTCSREHRLRVLRALRVLCRDEKLQTHFLSLSPLPALLSLFQSSSVQYLSAPSLYLSESLIELASILKRLVPNSTVFIQLVQGGMLQTVLLLLHSSDAPLLQAILVLLLHIEVRDIPHLLRAMENSSFTDELVGLLRGLPGEIQPYQSFTAELFDVLSDHSSARAMLTECGAPEVIGRIIQSYYRTLPPPNANCILLPLMHTLANLLIEPYVQHEMRSLGLVEYFVNLAKMEIEYAIATTQIQNNNNNSNSTTGNGSSSNSKLPPASTSPPSDPYSRLLHITRLIQQLSLDDANSTLIRNSNGIHIFAQLLFSINQAQLQIAVLHTLRFLYSLERNRSPFKKIFVSSNFFMKFVDLGAYCTERNKYEILLQEYNALPQTAKESMLQACNSLLTPANTNASIKGYRILEVLGQGSFGTVYQVRKENSDNVYAMKELSMKELHSGGMQEELTRAVTEVSKEVDILSQMDHPNIVKYYTSFVEGTKVYIIMELVEGTSLLDYISSFTSKQQHLPEEQIWPIFVQLCLALCYMHMEKRVVHRDLTPSNIMIDQRKKVRLVDLGLARQTHNGTILKSAVGTISFSCPEIVMHESYTAGADIWSLGCILYQMATGQAAFAGTNPLTVAQKIEMVRRLLTIDPAKRPDILQVSSLIAPLLMAELDRVNIALGRLELSVRYEAEQRRREQESWRREKQQLRRLLSTKQGSLSGANSTSNSATNLPTPADSSTHHNNNAAHNDMQSKDGNTHSAGNLSLPVSAPLNAASSSPSLLTLASHQLRPTAHDPLALLLLQLHKIIWITQLPPSMKRDRRRIILMKYKYELFNKFNKDISSKSENDTPLDPALLLKQEMQNILTSSSDFISTSFGLPQADTADYNSSGSATAPRLTHEQLHLMIEELCNENGYYNTEPNVPEQMEHTASKGSDTDSYKVEGK